MPNGESIATPRLRQAALITIVGGMMNLGVPFAEFRILPNLFVADSAAQTAQNLAAHHGLFLVAIFAYYLNFFGDIVLAWGLYLLLRPVNASISMFVAWVRVVFAALGLAALLNLVTANRLVTRASDLTALGRDRPRHRRPRVDPADHRPLRWREPGIPLRHVARRAGGGRLADRLGNAAARLADASRLHHLPSSFSLQS